MKRRETSQRARAREAVRRLNQSGLLPRYCTAELSRHDKICVYFRIVGRTGRIRIRSEPGSSEFHARYAALLRGDVPPTTTTAPIRAQTYSWRWLCEKHFQGLTFQSLAPRGQRVRRAMIEATYAEPVKPGSAYTFGDCPLDNFGARAVRVLRDRKVRWGTDTNGDRFQENLEAANSLLKYIRGVLEFAVEEYPELVSRNWGKDVPYFASSSHGIHTWTIDELMQFEEHFPVGTKARLTFALGLYTGQRRGDICRLGRILERNGTLEIVQEKNRRKKPVTAFVGIVPPLQAIIDATPTGDLFYVVQDNGKPYTKESLGNRFRKWCAEAGLPKRCSLHGLRKACVVRLIMDDCTPHEIMSVTGHRTLKEIDRYAREFGRQKAAERVLEKWLAKHA